MLDGAKFVVTDAQFSAIMERLGEMRDLLLILAVPPEAAEVGCQHPEEQRVSLASFGDPDHWVCRDCKHEHQGVKMN